MSITRWNDTTHGVWEAYRGELIRFVAGRVKSAEVAEDIVHDVLVKAYERWDQLKDPGSLRSWLFRITRNAVIDHYRLRKELDRLPDDFVDERGRSDGRAEKELARCLTPLIRTLPSHYRDVVEITEIGGMTQREAAAELGLSVSGAKSRVQRARKMLKDALHACCQVELDTRGRVMDYNPTASCISCSATETSTLQTADAEHRCA